MAAGLGFKTFTTGEVLTAADTNGYLMQGINVFASTAARDAAITSPQEGQFAYTKDTNSLWYYTGSAWAASGATGDIEGVTAGIGISGGGTSGTVTVTNSMATAIDAKGDLIAGTGADTFDRLAVGNNGETLVADSAATTGLRYQVPKTNNVVINGNLDIWQRGTSFTSVSSTTYTADRFQTNTSGTTINLTVTQDTSVPNSNSKYSLKFQQVTTGATSVSEYGARQFIEQSNILPLLGKSCVISFWYKSNKTGSHGIRIYGSYNTGGTDQTTTFTVNTADTWEYKTVAVTAFAAVSASSAAATSSGAIIDLGFRVNTAGFTTLSTNDYFQFTQLQLEVGSVATPFARAGATIQGELAACQRYYWRSTPQTGLGMYGLGIAGNSTQALVSLKLPVSMRVIPTSIDVPSTITWLKLTNYTTTNWTISAITLLDSTFDNLMLYVTSSSMTANQGLILGNNNSGGFIGASAEL
jgi:hypothetical protein